MAFMEDVRCRTYIAGQDLSASQFHFVTLAADGQVDPTGAGLRADGVLLNTPDAAGKAATVAYDGRVTVEAGGDITRGAAVTSNATGEAVAATSTDVILGYALEAGADGQIITIELSRAETVVA